MLVLYNRKIMEYLVLVFLLEVHDTEVNQLDVHIHKSLYKERFQQIAPINLLVLKFDSNIDMQSSRD